MTNLTIGQVAKISGASIDTIRFYERKNLISSVCRKASGYRQFHPRVIEHMTFIRNAKWLGFTLKEIEELLLIQQNPHAKASEAKQKAKEKITDINAKIEQLLRIREELQALTNACSGDGPTNQCPILEGIGATRKS